MLMNKVFKGITAGFSTGIANGLFGGGGGMVAVPLLTKMCNYHEKQAHATAIFIIAPICGVTAIVYIICGYARLNIIIPTAIGSTIGGLIGALLLNKFPKAIINYIFISIMLIAGIRMLF